MRARHARRDPALPGERMVAAGGVLFVVGVVALAVAVVPFLLRGTTAGLGPAVSAAMLLVVGLGLALGGVLRSARARRRAARRSATRS